MGPDDLERVNGNIITVAINLSRGYVYDACHSCSCTPPIGYSDVHAGPCYARNRPDETLSHGHTIARVKDKLTGPSFEGNPGWSITLTTNDMTTVDKSMIQAEDSVRDLDDVVVIYRFALDLMYLSSGNLIPNNDIKFNGLSLDIDHLGKDDPRGVSLPGA